MLIKITMVVVINFFKEIVAKVLPFKPKKKKTKKNTPNTHLCKIFYLIYANSFEIFFDSIVLKGGQGGRWLNSLEEVRRSIDGGTKVGK